MSWVVKDLGRGEGSELGGQGRWMGRGQSAGWSRTLGGERAVSWVVKDLGRGEGSELGGQGPWEGRGQ